MKNSKDFLNLLQDHNGPSFVFDLKELEKNFNSLKSFWRKKVSRNANIYYSLKSNPSTIIIKKLDSIGSCFDVSSLAELEILIALKIEPKKITVSGPAKSNAFILRCFEYGIYAIHLDSMEELAFYKCVTISQKPKMLLRWQLKDPSSHKIGFSLEQIKKILEDKSILVSGIHTYIGRENFNEEQLKIEVEKFKLTYLNSGRNIKDFSIHYGGGLPVLSILQKMNFDDCSEGAIPFPIHLEAGRSVVSSCGTYFTRVLSSKEREGKKILIVEGGLQHMASTVDSPRYGHSFRSLSHFKKTEDNQEWEVHGSLNIWTDVIARKALLPASLQRGDFVGINPVGAYGFTAGSNQFIGAKLPQELFWDGKVFTVNKLSSKLSYLESTIDEN